MIQVKLNYCRSHDCCVAILGDAVGLSAVCGCAMS